MAVLRTSQACKLRTLPNRSSHAVILLISICTVRPGGEIVTPRSFGSPEQRARGDRSPQPRGDGDRPKAGAPSVLPGRGRRYRADLARNLASAQARRPDAGGFAQRPHQDSRR